MKKEGMTKVEIAKEREQPPSPLQESHHKIRNTTLVCCVAIPSELKYFILGEAQ